MRHVFIIGSRGLPAKYGGFETFVEKLVENKVSSQIQYHVACLSDDEDMSHAFPQFKDLQSSLLYHFLGDLWATEKKVEQIIILPKQNYRLIRLL